MTDDDEVGYGHPPKSTRFKKGRSGNPKGRPRGTKNIKTQFEAALNERIEIRENGKTRSISKSEGIFKRHIHKALEGDNKSASLVINIMNTFGIANKEESADKAPIAQADQELLDRYMARRHAESEAREKAEKGIKNGIKKP